MPFAGLPTVGTAAVLAMENGGGDQVFGLELKAGITPCTAEGRGEGRAFARFRAPIVPKKLQTSVTAETAARALGIETDDIGEVAKWQSGIDFDLIELASLEALGRARIGPTFADTLGAAYMFVRVEGWTWWRTRMFSPAHGILEDPATGSAAVALAGLLHARALPGEGDHNVVIEQGVEMGRPSKIAMQLVCRGLTLEGVEIGGDVVVMSEGTLRI